MSKEELDARSMKAILAIASAWYDQMKSGEIPSISLPTRTKYNIELTMMRARSGNTGTKKASGHCCKRKKCYSSPENGLCDRFCQAAAQKENRSSTLREMYYISEGWKRAKFAAQDESNFLVEDLEIISDVPREGFHLRPEEDGASIYGPIRIREQTRRGLKTIHCQDDVGGAGYSIPNNVENIEFVDHDAKFVIAMETGGMYDRLIENGFDEEYNAVLLHLKGQPARSTRRMLNRIARPGTSPSVSLPMATPGHTGSMHRSHTGQSRVRTFPNCSQRRKRSSWVSSQAISGTITCLPTSYPKRM